ncbi:MAG: hypothetical protein GY749_34300 [Desulfobacteraceae bacterium]|nr:hypothetical protein [Desulfobacteraceae bacterium]
MIESEKKQSALKRWGSFLLCIALILTFIFVIGPLMERLPFVRPVISFIEEREIDATALYYTEIEEFSEAEINMRNTMDYQPGKLKKNKP